MTSSFDGPDLFVGEIRALRTFDLRSDGSLWPVFAADRAWNPGINEARCPRHQPAAAPGCKCGFWAYGDPAPLRDQPASINVAAVVSCWGRATPGTRGLRAQFAQIDAVWVSRRVSRSLREKLVHRYPNAQVFDDRAAMLAAYPLTVLPAYDAPIRRAPADVAARVVLRALAAMLIVLGLLPAALQDSGWPARAHDAAVHILVSTSVAVVVWWVVDRWVQRNRRSPTTLVALTLGALDAWVAAPYVGVWWQLLLRAPLLFVLVPYVANRTVRFLPNPAAPAPSG